MPPDSRAAMYVDAVHMPKAAANMIAEYSHSGWWSSHRSALVCTIKIVMPSGHVSQGGHTTMSAGAYLPDGQPVDTH